jgi:hypothetical protein
MKKIVRLTESDLSRLVKRVISENNKTINEGMGTALLILGGMGLAYLVHRLKKFLDKVGRYLPSANLVGFLNKVKKVESGEIDGEVVVKSKGDYKFIVIAQDKKIIDGLTINMYTGEIFDGIKHAWTGKEPSVSDRIVPVELPSAMRGSEEEMETLKRAEEELVDGIMKLLAKYTKPKDLEGF